MVFAINLVVYNFTSRMQVTHSTYFSVYVFMGDEIHRISLYVQGSGIVFVFENTEHFKPYS